MLDKIKNQMILNTYFDAWKELCESIFGKQISDKHIKDLREIIEGTETEVLIRSTKNLIDKLKTNETNSFSTVILAMNEAIVEMRNNPKKEVRLSTTVMTSAGYVWIDTNDTIDYGWETMVFKCDENGKVTSWVELDVDRYDDYEEAKEGHERMVSEWKLK